MLSSLMVVWLISGFLSFGSIALNYICMKKLAKSCWKIKKDNNYRPKISVIVPTYNEGEVIEFKLKNLLKLDYPSDLMQVVFVDSQSNDSTTHHIWKFAEMNKEKNIQVIVERERKGKSFALNAGLKSCVGDIIIVSDADCFWPSDILSRAIPYLTSPSVGAVSGPKKLLNPTDSWVTRNEDTYLKSMNLVKLGESKMSSTIFFEGGFSAYKREVLEHFDPYNTGSDDCGTVMSILKKGYKTIMVSEAEFFTTFPKNLDEKIEMKLRRASQLVRIFSKYLYMLIKNEIKVARKIVAKNVFLYLFTPLIFLIFVATTFLMILNFPQMLLLLLLLFVPKVRDYLIEALLNYLILLYSIFSTLLKRKNRFITWKKPKDRVLLSEKMLVQYDLI